jgi:TonB family protein
MSENNLILRCEIVVDGEVVRTEDLDQDVVKVGKLGSSHLKLDDASVSRIHAVIERSVDGAYNVIDLGSATGTYVNGEKVTKSAVEDGDELQFGDTLVRVHIVDAAEAAAEAEAAAAPAMITLEDGTEVEPYTLQGYYDDAGNYIPGYYDAEGNYELGYGYYDDEGNWQVSHGYYDAAGEWIDSDTPVSAVAAAASDSASGAAVESDWAFAGTSDREVYRENFFNSRGGDTLEVAMVWQDAVIAVNTYQKARNVTVGSNKKDDFYLEDVALRDDPYPLVVFEGGYTLTVTPEMGGTIKEGDQEYTLQQAIEQGIARPSAHVGGAYGINLTGRTSAAIDVGDTTFLVHFTDMPIVAAGGVGFDTAPLPYLGLSAVAHILFLLLAMTWPDRAGSLDLDGFNANDRFVQLMLQPEQIEEEPDWMDDDGGDEEAAAKHKGEEGKAGKEDSEQVDKKLAIKGPADNEDMELKRARDTEVAMNSGIAGELMVSSPWGTSSTSVGSDAIHALGNLQGGEFGEAKGFGGLGLSGAGRGGGGISERGIGLANVGTAGRGGGGRGGSGYGKGAGDLGERNARVPKIVPGKPAVQGSLDKEIIRRVVRQHRREIKFCYEQQLQKNKNLKGRVVVKFTISATGSVVSAVVKESSLNDAAVERCMTGKIRRWVFPEPKGGGIVIVNYPFNLSS